MKRVLWYHKAVLAHKRKSKKDCDRQQMIISELFLMSSTKKDIQKGVVFKSHRLYQ